MKLALKLTLAPVATAAVMLLAATGSAIVAVRHYGHMVADGEAQATLMRTLSAREGEIATAHAGVYRTVALMASLDEKQVKQARATLAERLRGVKQAFGQDAQEAGRQIDAYLKHADMAIDLASVDPNTGIAALQSADAAFAAVSKEAGRIVEAARAAGAERRAAERARAGAVIGGLALASLVLTGLALGLTLRMQRRLVHDLNAARQAAECGAAGDLTHALDSARRDELGDLLRAVAAMQGSLSRVVAEVRGNAESVATASEQIAQGNQDLSQRTEQQASALQETAASMEELGSTVKQNADNAKQANQLAQGASAVAVKGGEVVGQVVGTMKGISDSSKKIADIIGVIDGIAFQTNILALNAAVEAARAGEQGRGFAVVAGEVRSLAGRSADAAKEIKTLINASVERVEQGTTLVDQAGSTMEEIVGAIKRVTDIMGEISTASAEQSSGVAQVGQAITQMDQATQQNAALVEESAAAAESLRGQAQLLVQSVAVFKLAQCATAATAAPAFAERRSADRAKNVMRPKFGAGKAKAAAPTPTAEATPAKTGTDGEWTSF